MGQNPCKTKTKTNIHTMPLLRCLLLTRDLGRSIENAVGNAFLQLLAETEGRGEDQRFVLESLPSLTPPFSGFLTWVFSARARPCINVYGC